MTSKCTKTTDKQYDSIAYKSCRAELPARRGFQSPIQIINKAAVNKTTKSNFTGLIFPIQTMYKTQSGKNYYYAKHKLIINL